MALHIVVLLASFFIPFLLPQSYSSVLIVSAGATPIPGSDVDLLEFPLNLEYLEAEFFLFGSLGHGLDVVAPGLAQGGPPPIGARLAKLGILVRDVILQFGLQEVGHLRFSLVSASKISFESAVLKFLGESFVTALIVLPSFAVVCEIFPETKKSFD